MTKVSGFSRNSRHKIEYPDIPSAIKPVVHGEDLPVSGPTANWEKDLIIYDDKSESDKRTILIFSSKATNKHLISSNKLNSSRPSFRF